MKWIEPRTLLAVAAIGLVGASPESALPDPLAAGWKGKPACELLLENERIRSLRCTFAPGEGHERHFHRPHWGYILQGSTMQMTDAKGSVVRELKAGTSWWSDGIEWHEVVNVGPTTGVYIITEPKV